MAIGKIFNRFAIYSFGQLMRSMASFLMLPIYTTYLTPADYGIIELLSIILDLTAILVGSRISEGIFKYYTDAENDIEKGKVVTTAFFMVFSLNAIGYVFIYLLSDVIANYLDTAVDFSSALKIFALTLVLGTINEIFFTYLRILDRPIIFISLNLLKLLVQITVNIILIVYMEMTYWGIIYGALISSGLLTIIFSLWLLPKLEFRLSYFYFKKLLNFSIPIILSSFAMYYITFGDRYYLNIYHDVQEVGLYALAYKFAFLLGIMVWRPFNMYWGPKSYELANENNAASLFGKVFLYSNILLLSLAAMLIALTPNLLRVMSDESFFPAVEIIPWLVAAYLIQSWNDFYNFGIFKSGKTKHIAYASYMTVAVISVFYISLIPSEGGIGAAKATLYAFIFRFLYTYYISNRFFNIKIEWTKLLFLLGYFISITLFTKYIDIPLQSELIIMLVKSVLIFSLILLTLFTPIISKDDRDSVYALIKSKRRHI